MVTPPAQTISERLHSLHQHFGRHRERLYEDLAAAYALGCQVKENRDEWASFADAYRKATGKKVSAKKQADPFRYIFLRVLPAVSQGKPDAKLASKYGRACAYLVAKEVKPENAATVLKDVGVEAAAREAPPKKAPRKARGARKATAPKPNEVVVVLADSAREALTDLAVGEPLTGFIVTKVIGDNGVARLAIEPAFGEVPPTAPTDDMVATDGASGAPAFTDEGEQPRDHHQGEDLLLR